MNSKLKTILIVLGVIVIIGVVIYFVSGKKEQVTSRGLVSSTTGAPVTNAITPGSDTIGRDFVSMLLNIRDIKLDNSLFNDPSFQSLNDFTITLVQPGGEGRANPFAPFTTTVVPTLNIQNNPALINGGADDLALAPEGNVETDEDL
jgi:hypothetical protein